MRATGSACSSLPGRIGAAWNGVGSVKTGGKREEKNTGEISTGVFVGLAGLVLCICVYAIEERAGKAGTGRGRGLAGLSSHLSAMQE
ncbi:hypothetical protein GDO81_011857 [Engystomops pustulosus]|uniref:Uncharacterized protein n=1 Tax=Engystomops pustulosus TaxID=76066 RepID=A0AAV7BH86_ENGPU|nr:hypothetical protein GDO81_011857 [Engystomops pustulosus]